MASLLERFLKVLSGDALAINNNNGLRQL